MGWCLMIFFPLQGQSCISWKDGEMTPMGKNLYSCSGGAEDFLQNFQIFEVTSAPWDHICACQGWVRRCERRQQLPPALLPGSAPSPATHPQCSAGYIEPRYISCSRAKPPGEASLTARCLIRQGNQGAELQAHAGLTHHLPTATSHNPAALTSPARTPWFHYCMSPSASDAHCIFVSFWL